LDSLAANCAAEDVILSVQLGSKLIELAETAVKSFNTPYVLYIGSLQKIVNVEESQPETV